MTQVLVMLSLLVGVAGLLWVLVMDRVRDDRSGCQKKVHASWSPVRETKVS
jgi:hypothetical protein